MEIKDREAQERKIAEALERLTTAHREQLIRYLGKPPDINRVPPEFWKECEMDIKDELKALLLLLFLHSGSALVAQIGAERIPGTLANIEQTAQQWAEQEAERTAQQVTATTIDRVGKAAAGYYDDLDPNALKDRIEGVYGPDRAAGIARDKTTNAQTAGQQAVKQGAAGEGVTMVAWWNSSKDSDVCPLCRPLHGKPESFWSRYAPNGPGEEFHHGCRCFLDYKPGTDEQGTPFEESLTDLGKPLSQLLLEGWITLKPNGGDEEGYARVYVGDGGKIEKGPAGIAAKGFDNVKDFGKGGPKDQGKPAGKKPEPAKDKPAVKEPEKAPPAPAPKAGPAPKPAPAVNPASAKDPKVVDKFNELAAAQNPDKAATLSTFAFQSNSAPKNDYLRTGNGSPADAKAANDMQATILKHGKLPEQTTVYRGIQGEHAKEFLAQAEKAQASGKPIALQGISATSLAGDLPFGTYAGDGDGVVMVMKTQTGLVGSGKLMGSGVPSKPGGAHEILLPHGAEYRVAKVEHGVEVNGKKFSVIEMEEVGAAAPKATKPAKVDKTHAAQSKAALTHHDIDRKEIDKVSKRIGIKTDHISSLVGAPDDARVNVSVLGNNAFDVVVEGPGYKMQRTIERRPSGTVITNESLYVDKDKQGKGLGTDIFAKQVHWAEKNGVQAIETQAARGSKENGYYTWARLGYDGQIPTNVTHSPGSDGNWHPRKDIPAIPGGASTVGELMKSQEGRDWWKAHGNTTRMRFDTSAGSANIKRLNAYVAERAARKKGASNA